MTGHRIPFDIKKSNLDSQSEIEDRYLNGVFNGSFIKHSKYGGIYFIDDNYSFVNIDNPEKTGLIFTYVNNRSSSFLTLSNGRGFVSDKNGGSFSSADIAVGGFLRVISIIQNGFSEPNYYRWHELSSSGLFVNF